MSGRYNNHAYTDLNVDMSKFRLRYCDNQFVIFTHINDPLDDIYKNYVRVASSNGWMGSDLEVVLYIDELVVHTVSQLDEALVELDKIFST